MKTYYVYIMTNATQSVLYTGITNDLNKRQGAHYDANGNPCSFTGRYGVHHLIYYETYTDVKEAIAREKQIKGWRRSKKVNLIATQNPQWNFLNEEQA